MPFLDSGEIYAGPPSEKPFPMNVKKKQKIRASIQRLLVGIHKKMKIGAQTQKIFVDIHYKIIQTNCVTCFVGSR